MSKTTIFLHWLVIDQKPCQTCYVLILSRDSIDRPDDRVKRQIRTADGQKSLFCSFMTSARTVWNCFDWQVALYVALREWVRKGVDSASSTVHYKICPNGMRVPKKRSGSCQCSTLKKLCRQKHDIAWLRLHKSCSGDRTDQHGRDKVDGTERSRRMHRRGWHMSAASFSSSIC